MHSACKPHLHLTHLLLHCAQCSAPPLLPPLHPSFPEGPAALDALHTQPGTFAARFPPVWRCEAGLCDALTPVIVSPKCKAVAPSCGQVFSWEFYSGKVPDVSPQVHTADVWGYRQSWPWDEFCVVPQGQAVLTAACLIWSVMFQNVCFNSPRCDRNPDLFCLLRMKLGTKSRLPSQG